MEGAPKPQSLITTIILFVATLRFQGTAHFQGDVTVLEREKGSCTPISRVNKEHLQGKGKMPLAPTPTPQHMCTGTHTHAHAHARAHTHCLPQPAYHHQSAPFCLLFAGSSLQMCSGAGSWRRRWSWGLGREGRQRHSQRVKTLPCQTVNSPQLSPIPPPPSIQPNNSLTFSILHEKDKDGKIFP